MPSKNSTMIRVPWELKERLERLAGEILAAYEKGQGYQGIELTEQGTRGTWVPLSSVIDLALDELEDHRERSRKSRGKETKQTATVNSEVSVLSPIA